MNVKVWLWCLHCERCFQVLLSKQPQWRDDEETQVHGESVFDYGYELEVQIGVETDGEVYATCPYEDCDGSLLDFKWWKEFSAGYDGTPEVPAAGAVYPLYPPDATEESEA